MPDSARHRLAEARRLIRGDQAAEAIALLSQIEANPQQRGVKPLCEGLAALRAGEADAAADHIENALEIDPKNRVAQNWLAVAWARQGKHAEAVAQIERVGLVPYDEILAELALVIENHLLCHPEKRRETGLDPDVLRTVRAGDLDAAGPGKHLGGGALHRAYQRFDFPALLGHAVACLKKRGTETLGRHGLIHVMLESGLVSEALEDARALAAKEEGDPFVLSMLALCAIHAGEQREAIEAAAKIPVEGPDDFGCHWLLGLAALRAGAEGEARRFFLKGLGGYFITTFEVFWARCWWNATGPKFRP